MERRRTLIEKLKRTTERLAPLLVEWRRDFHRHPEVAFQEERTSNVIKDFLESLGLPVRKMAGTGLRADLKGRPGGKTVALRADIDALPLQEEGDKDYKSKNAGAMHACGHDGHMAIVMGAAKILKERKNEFKGNVVFLFQPSEELPPGGAKPMIEEGALEGVDAIFGLHLWQGLPTGKIGTGKGPLMAAADNFSILVKGKAGHGSMPHQTVDPIFAASQLVCNVQSIVSRNVDPLKPAVVSFGKIQGGTINNIIPDHVRLKGTVRSFDSEVQELAEKRLKEIAGDTCRAFGAEAELIYEKGYPALINHDVEVDFLLEVVKRTLGGDRISGFDPIMGGEDFAYYLQKIPGAFFFFGAGDGNPYPHHHPKFDIDEKALPEAAMLMANLVLQFLVETKEDKK
jgi:amidohydrolase